MMCCARCTRCVCHTACVAVPTPKLLNAVVVCQRTVGVVRQLGGVSGCAVTAAVAAWLLYTVHTAAILSCVGVCAGVLSAL